MLDFVVAIVVVGGFGLAILVVNDRLEASQPPPQPGPHFLRELNQPWSIWRNLWMTFELLVIGLLAGLADAVLRLGRIETRRDRMRSRRDTPRSRGDLDGRVAVAHAWLTR
jgi:hypothetical protein